MIKFLNSASRDSEREGPESVCMAKRFCELCDKYYDFRSRYDRHLLSSRHRNLEEAKHQRNDFLAQNVSEGDHCLLPRCSASAAVGVSSTDTDVTKMIHECFKCLGF